MRALVLSLAGLVGLAACGGSQRPRLAAQVAEGSPPAQGAGVLVFTARCAGMDGTCPKSWATTVDAIVTSGLSFHGYAMLDPTKLRKDEAQRQETTIDKESQSSSSSNSSSGGVGVVGIIPIASYETSSGTTVSMSQSTEKTVILTGAVLEDLALPDRAALMELAGARMTLTTQIIVGANWNVWTTNQAVEVMIKLSNAQDGTMHWSARCMASSQDYANIGAAIEAASRCVVDAIVAPPSA